MSSTNTQNDSIPVRQPDILPPTHTTYRWRNPNIGSPTEDRTGWLLTISSIAWIRQPKSTKIVGMYKSCCSSMNFCPLKFLTICCSCWLMTKPLSRSWHAIRSFPFHTSFHDANFAQIRSRFSSRLLRGFRVLPLGPRPSDHFSGSVPHCWIITGNPWTPRKWLISSVVSSSGLPDDDLMLRGLDNWAAPCGLLCWDSNMTVLDVGVNEEAGTERRKILQKVHRR